MQPGGLASSEPLSQLSQPLYYNIKSHDVCNQNLRCRHKYSTASRHDLQLQPVAYKWFIYIVLSAMPIDIYLRNFASIVFIVCLF